jgi:hypothetical protein
MQRCIIYTSAITSRYLEHDLRRLTGSGRSELLAKSQADIFPRVNALDPVRSVRDSLAQGSHEQINSLESPSFHPSTATSLQPHSDPSHFDSCSLRVELVGTDVSLNG